MAANRFWGGIPATHGGHDNLSFMTPPSKDTFIVSVQFVSPAGIGAAVSQLFLIGKHVGETVPRELLSIPGNTIGTITLNNLCIQLEPGTLVWAQVAGAAGSSSTVILQYVSLDAGARNVQPILERRFDVQPSEYVMRSAYYLHGETEIALETLIVAGGIITVPALQATPAVIDELEVLSDSGSDDGDGVIDYWDNTGAEYTTAAFTLNGTTAVTSINGTDLIAVQYDDIWVVKGVRMTSGLNVGNVLLTDSSA